MNNNYYDEDDNSAYGMCGLFQCVPLCGWVPTMLIIEHGGSFLNVVEGSGVPVKPGYCSFIKVKQTVTYLLYIKNV